MPSSKRVEDESSDEEEDEQKDQSMLYCMVLVLTLFAWNAVLLFLLSDMGPSMGVRLDVATLSRATDLAGLGCIAIGATLSFVFYIMDWVNWHPKCKVATGLVIFGLMFAGICLNAWVPGTSMLLVVFSVPALIALINSCFKTSPRSKQHFINGSVTLVVALLILGCWLVWVFVGANSFPSGDRLGHMVAERQDVQMLYSAVFPTRALNHTEDCLALANNATQFGNESNATQFGNASNATQFGNASNATQFGNASNATQLGNESKAIDGAIVKACGNAAVFLVSAWAYPLVAFFAHLVMAVFAFANWAHMRHTTAGQAMEKTEHLMVLGVSLLALLIVGMYSASNMEGSGMKLGKLLSLSFVVGVVTIAGWLYAQLQEDLAEQDADAALFEASGETLDKALEMSGMKKNLYEAAQSDWVKAAAVFALNLLIPIYLAMAWARDKFREHTDRSAFDEGDEESYFDKISSMLAKWDWAGVLFKVCLLGDAYIVGVVIFTKGTYIFLAWLRVFLAANLAFHWVLLAAFIIAVLLYVLLPPMPGVAVNMFCGILVLGQVKDNESISFPVGCLIATILALLAKLGGSATQYVLGYFLGKNLFIQQQVGVDSVFIRATEEVMRRPGLDPGKVAILVGGPDWPTSVLCGVLKVSLCQVMLGTLPVLFVTFPSVMAAAFQTLQVYGETNIYNTLGSACMMLTAVAQPLSSVLATQSILSVLSENEEELKKSRPEHKAVEELSALQAKKDEVYKKVTEWKTLGCFRKTLVILAALLALISSWTMVAAADLCFRPFTVSNLIGDPFEKGGLEGRPLNIVRGPLGWLPLAIYLVSAVLQLAFQQITSADARKEWDDQEDEDSEE